jgi:hypothetical protein
MKKFLLPLTTALAALLSQSPVSDAHTAGNDQSGDVSRLTDQHKMPVYFKLIRLQPIWGNRCNSEHFQKWPFIPLNQRAAVFAVLGT